MTRRVTVAEAQALLNERGNQAVRALTLDLFRRIVFRTPVGNPDLWQQPAPPGYVGGTARNSWMLGLGTPDPTLPGYPEGTGQDAIARMEPVLDTYRGGMLYITNALPYIERLEDGWSQQAPSGMVALAVAEVEPLAAQIATEIRYGEFTR